MYKMQSLFEQTFDICSPTERVNFETIYSTYS